MMLEYIFRFITGFTILSLFECYIYCFKDEKKKITFDDAIRITIVSLCCSAVHYYRIPILSVLVTVVGIVIECCLISSRVSYKVSMAISFVALGASVQCQGFLLYDIFDDCRLVQWDKKHFILILLFLIMLSAVVLSLCHCFGNRKIRLKSLAVKISFIISAFSSILMMSSGLVTQIARASERKIDKIAAIIIISLMIETIYLILYMIKYMGKFMDRLYEDECRIAEMNYTAHHYEELEDVYMNMKELKHNLKNRLLEFEYYLKNEDCKGLIEKLKDVSEEMNSLDKEIHSGNPMINSILQAKIGLARKRNIDVRTDVMIPANIRLKDGHMGTIFGDLLDNAIEACEKMRVGERYIKIVGKIDDDTIYIKVENSKSSKDSIYGKRMDRGIGQLSIKRLFADYDGYIDFSDEGTRYIATGVINVNKCIS